MASTFSTALVPSVSSTRITSPTWLNRSSAMTRLGLGAEHDDVLPLGLKRKPDAEWADDVAGLSGLEGGHAARAAAHAFVEELEPLPGAVDAVDALRPAQPEAAVIGCRAEDVEELARL